MRYVIILLLVFTSSRKNEDKKELNQTIFCDNERALFEDKTLPTIDIDLNDNYENIKTQIQSQSDADFCSFPRYNFTFKYNEEQTLLPFIVFDCPEIRYHPNLLEFYFNEKGQFLIDSQKIELDSISSFVEKSITTLRSQKQTKIFFFSFNLKQKIDEVKFNLILKNTTTGILNYYKNLSLKRFDKEICELDKSDFMKITSEFEIKFTSSEVFETPLPPIKKEL